MACCWTADCASPAPADCCFGGAGDLLGAFLRFGRRPLGFEGRVQHLLAALRDSPHVLPAIFEGLHDRGRRLGFGRGHLRRFLHRADDAADIDLNFACEPFDFLGALVGRLRQRANLVGDHRKAAPVIARARRLDRGVQRQEVGLVGDAADRLRDFADIPGAALQFGDDLDRRALPLRVALDRASRGGDALRRVAEHDLHVFRAPAQGVCFAARRAKAVEYPLDGRELLLRGAGGLLGAAGDLLHRLAQLLGRRGSFRQSARKFLGRRRHSLEEDGSRRGLIFFVRRGRLRTRR